VLRGSSHPSPNSKDAVSSVALPVLHCRLCRISLFGGGGSTLPPVGTTSGIDRSVTSCCPFLSQITARTYHIINTSNVLFHLRLHIPSILQLARSTGRFFRKSNSPNPGQTVKVVVLVRPPRRLSSAASMFSISPLKEAAPSTFIKLCHCLLSLVKRSRQV